jgi:hypothetical protein
MPPRLPRFAELESVYSSFEEFFAIAIACVAASTASFPLQAPLWCLVFPASLAPLCALSK